MQIFNMSATEMMKKKDDESNSGGGGNITNNLNNSNKNKTNSWLQGAININDIYRNITEQLDYMKNTYSDGNILMSTMAGAPYSLDLDSSINLSQQTKNLIEKSDDIKNIFNESVKDVNDVKYEDLLNFTFNLCKNSNLPSKELKPLLQTISNDIKAKKDTKKTIFSALGWSTTILGTGSTTLYLLSVFKVITFSPALQWVLLGITIATALYLLTTRMINLKKSVSAQTNADIDNLYDKSKNCNQGLVEKINNEMKKDVQTEFVRKMIDYNKQPEEIDNMNLKNETNNKVLLDNNEKNILLNDNQAVPTKTIPNFSKNNTFLNLDNQNNIKKEQNQLP